ncbi:MAG TPA: response regulator transcription factor [Thermoleophilaceae bacterium]|nr:response regulator transcription factor [Thermoleophilaceae bacterium]
MSRLRVLLADDHTLLLEAFKGLLAPHFDVVGAVGDGQALLEAAEELRPDVVIADISMPRLNGIEALRALRKSRPGTRVVFLTVNEEPETAAEAFRSGALGYLLKNATGMELVEAVHAVMRGRRYLSRAIAGGDPESLPIPAAHELAGEVDAVERMSEREREVVRLIASGLSMPMVAEQLGITARTVAFHKYRAMEKLGAKSHTQLVRLAIRHHLG